MTDYWFKMMERIRAEKLHLDWLARNTDEGRLHMLIAQDRVARMRTDRPSSILLQRTSELIAKTLREGTHDAKTVEEMEEIVGRFETWS